MTGRLSLSEWALWACADEAIWQHGLDAPIFAGMRADKLLEEREIDSAANWRMIVTRINQLLAKPAGRTN